MATDNIYSLLEGATGLEPATSRLLTSGALPAKLHPHNVPQPLQNRVWWLADRCPLEEGQARQVRIHVLLGERLDAERHPRWTAEAMNVRIMMPEGLEPVASGKYHLSEGMIEFPVQRLSPGGKVVLGFQVVGQKIGEHKVRVKLDDIALSRELTFEGSAFCYLPTDETGEIRTALFPRQIR